MIEKILTLLLICQAYTGKSGTTVFVPGPSAAPVSLLINNDIVPLTLGPIANTYIIPRKLSPKDSLTLSYGTKLLSCSNLTDSPAPRIPSTMKLGYNIVHYPLRPFEEYCPVANWAVRLNPWDKNVLEKDIKGNPTKLATTKVSTNFMGRSTSNLVDKSGIPRPIGQFTLIYETTDPLTSLAIETYDSGWVSREISNISINTKVTKVFDISKSSQFPLPTTPLALSVSHPTKSPNFSNLQILPPGNSSVPLSIEKWSYDTLVGSHILRFTDAALSGSYSSLINSSDLPDITKSSWNIPSPTITTNVIQLRPIQTVSIISDTSLPSFLYPWDFGYRWVAEAVTSTPHGIKTGQYGNITFPSPIDITPNLTSSAPLPPVPNISSVFWVTSPTSFIVIGGYSTLLSPRGPVNLNSSINVTGTATVSITGTIPLPYEFVASMSSQLKAICWIAVPITATEETIDAIATKLAQYPCRVIVEANNEAWNYLFKPTHHYLAMSRMLNQDDNYYYIYRSQYLADRFRYIYRKYKRPNSDVLSVLAGQYGSMDYLLTQAVKMGMKADIVSTAPYFEFYFPLNDLTIPQIHDFLRYSIINDKRWAAWDIQLAKYETAIGKRVLRYAYEGGIDVIFPYPTDYSSGKVWNFVFHPDMYDTEITLFNTAQKHGFDTFVYLCHLMSITTSGATYPVYNWQGQKSGRGFDNIMIDTINSSINSSINPIFPYNNVSVRGQAFIDWRK